MSQIFHPWLCCAPRWHVTAWKYHLYPFGFPRQTAGAVKHWGMASSICGAEEGEEGWCVSTYHWFGPLASFLKTPPVSFITRRQPGLGPLHPALGTKFLQSSHARRPEGGCQKTHHSFSADKVVPFPGLGEGPATPWECASRLVQSWMALLYLSGYFKKLYPPEVEEVGPKNLDVGTRFPGLS